MLTSVAWINAYLDPPASADEQADLLTRAGFPLERREPLDNDVRQEYELPSNRGDCLSHLGLAREIAAISGRMLRPPGTDDDVTDGTLEDPVTVNNEVPGACPLYTARVIRDATVGPSPDWLAQRLTARGDQPRNNVVDATNFVLFELGQPTHVFDLDLIEGGTIVVRMARAGETLLPIGEDAEPIELSEDDLVIADATRPVALAGVKGGAKTAVTADTKHLLIESATFDPVLVRAMSRRHGITSDSSYRFERGVHPAQLGPAAERLVSIILKVAGGTRSPGVATAGEPIPGGISVSMRCDRCRDLLGVAVSTESMLDALARLGFEPGERDGHITGTVPVYRGDVQREIDLVEEVARMQDYDSMPVAEMLPVHHARMDRLEPVAEARRAVQDALVGIGLVETVTHALVGIDEASDFLSPGAALVTTVDDRAETGLALRPSILPSLLRVHRHNTDGGTSRLGLFEIAATWSETPDGHQERLRCALLLDAEDAGAGLRTLRGQVDRIVELLRGPGAQLVAQLSESTPWFDPGADLLVDGAPAGVLGRIAGPVARRHGIDGPMLAAELDLEAMVTTWPPSRHARPLPIHPAIDRDLTLVIDEATSWASLVEAIESEAPAILESLDFITVFRGKGVPAERKALTMRLRFRATDRTLLRVEADDSMTAIRSLLEARFDAEIRH